jgi:hypothetical protein
VPPWLAAALPCARLKGTAFETGLTVSPTPVLLPLAPLSFELSAALPPASGHATWLALAGCRANGLWAPLPAPLPSLLPGVADIAGGAAAAPLTLSAAALLPAPALLALPASTCRGRYAGCAVTSGAVAVRPADGLSACSANRTKRQC